jgi:hypothetical protein
MTAPTWIVAVLRPAGYGPVEAVVTVTVTEAVTLPPEAFVAVST